MNSDRYLIRKECGLRLTLTGTKSITDSFQESLKSYIQLNTNPETTNINPSTVTNCGNIILNKQRKEDNTANGITLVFNKKGEIAEEGFSIELDFAGFSGDTGYFFYINKKKMGGTPPQRNIYIMIAKGMQLMYGVSNVKVHEILMFNKEPNAAGEFLDLIVAPPQSIIFSELDFQNAIKDVFTLDFTDKGDSRKCNVSCDPCPAVGICPLK